MPVETVLQPVAVHPVLFVKKHERSKQEVYRTDRGFSKIDLSFSGYPPPPVIIIHQPALSSSSGDDFDDNSC